MWLSGLFLLLVFGASLYFGQQRIHGLALPQPWLLAGVLAVLLTLFVGSLQGLWEAWRQRGQPAQPASAWQDGAVVRVTGVVEPLDRTVTTPLGDRPALFYEYAVKALTTRDHTPGPEWPGWRGDGRSPAQLRVGTQAIRLSGMPSLKHLAWETLDEAAVLPRVAERLADTRWEVAPDLANVEDEQWGRWAAGELPPTLRRDLINRTAIGYLALQPGRSTAQGLFERLQSRPWSLRERRITPGETITVEGSWRAGRREIEIGYGVWTSAHAVHRGESSTLATRQLGVALAFVAVLGLLTAAGHALVHWRQGALLRSVLGAIERAS